MDGVFDQRDAWGIGRSAADAASNSSAGIERHCWLDGKAWRPTGVDPHGRWIDLAPFDPGMTEAEEKAAADVTRVDREAPRAKTPLVFGHDLAAALATAKQTGKRVVVDFETTWCGPCKMMDQIVWPAQAVVDACADVVPVKLDGDAQRELVKRYEVTAYPTVLVLDQDGEVLQRAVGYQSVARLSALLRK
ncbi:MAG: thioredoxin family protein [Planctomycetes bacterium]|nr:thioredoxin family protein [Planctomycetota bacterium]